MLGRIRAKKSRQHQHSWVSLIRWCGRKEASEWLTVTVVAMKASSRPATTLMMNLLRFQFSANRTSGAKAEQPGIAQPKPAQFSREYDGIRIAGDHSENNLFEAQFTETSSGSNWRGVVETTDDLLGGAEWSSEPAENLAGGITLLDIAESEPSNFNLLVGDVSGSNQDLFGGEKQNPFLGAEDPVATSAPQQSNQNQFDLISSPFHSAVPTPAAAHASKLSEKTISSPQNQTKSPAEDDFLALFEGKPQEEATNDDLLGQWNASNITSAGLGMMGPMPRPTSRPDLKATSVPHNNSSSGMENLFGQSGQKMDPFGDLGNLAGLKPGLGNGNNYQNKNMMKNASGSSLTNTGRSSSPMMMAGVTSPMGSGTPAWQPSPQHQTNPNYSAGPRSKVDEHTFKDLLGDHTFPSTKKEPQTIKEMRKTLDAKATDPDTLKVREWTEGKERNIRALLCSLHTVLWEDEERWKEVGMHQIISLDEVRKCYKKATLSVHPDKLSGDPHEELARLILIELNNAWSEFKETGMKSLYS